MSRLRAELVCEQALHGVACTLHLGDYIRLGHGEERSGGRERPSILADAVEAVIAAMYLDGGLEPAQRFILAHILNGLAEGEIHHVADYKTELQERVQRRAGQTLSYTVCAESVRTTTRRSPWPCCSTAARSAAARGAPKGGGAVRRPLRARNAELIPRAAP